MESRLARAENIDNVRFGKRCIGAGMNQFYLNSPDVLLMRSTELFPPVPNLPKVPLDRGRQISNFHPRFPLLSLPQFLGSPPPV